MGAGMSEFAGDRVKLLLDNLWPSLVPGDQPLDAYKLQKVLIDSQWLERHEMEDYQLEHLRNLVKFAAYEAPFWRARIGSDLLDDANTLAEALARLPVLSREDVRDAGDALRAERLPQGEVLATTMRPTSASGVTVQVATTELGLKWRRSFDLRRLLWAGVDFDRSIAVIQDGDADAAPYPAGARYDRWKDANEIPFRTGPSFHLNARASAGEQLEWLKRMAPAYLHADTSLIRDLAAIAHEGELKLDTILTRGDVVDGELRSIASAKFNARIHDRYISAETGYLAIQCPDTDAYHVPSEAVIVEVVDDEGRPCKDGEIGRVVVTPLFNLAGLLIRYAIGDVAEAGTCECGRSLPTLKRIAHRREMLGA
jgi:phenylacetate-CoA ligase